MDGGRDTPNSPTSSRSVQSAIASSSSPKSPIESVTDVVNFSWVPPPFQRKNERMSLRNSQGATKSSENANPNTSDKSEEEKK